MSSKSSRQGVDVVLESLHALNTPHCAHGPTLLFERCVEGSLKQFYACSACRDRKNCSFFQWADQHLSEEQLAVKKKRMLELQKPVISQIEYRKRLTEIRKLPKQRRAFCQQCGLLLLPSEMKDHEEHRCIMGISKAMLRHPTGLLAQLSDNRTNAQYHFSESALQFFIDTIRRLGFKRVLCIGAPRVHEEICAHNIKKDLDVKSLLLDIDQRLEQFYSEKQFCLYNMFNHYFFRGAKSELRYKEVLEEDGKHSDGHGSILVIMDPPFGGLVEVLSHTVKRIQNDWQQVNPEQSGFMPFFWIFPYFMESRIIQCLPSFVMLDYKVTYDNHRVFTGSKKSNRHGSPVRIFTNLSPAQIILPSPEYRFCELCNRYVSLENKHCQLCNACTSKDGRQYTHCNQCKRCVKPSWSHCNLCNTCHLPDYNCQVPNTGCHICGDPSHKRKDCPEKGTGAGIKRKHHSPVSVAEHKKKRKK